MALKRVHGACVISANTKHMKQLIEQKDAQVSVLEKERGRLEERLRIKEAAIKAYSASVAHIEQLTVERDRLRAKVAESQANLLIKDDMLAMKFELNRRDRQRQLARDLLCKLIPSLGMEYTQNYTADRRHPAGVKITGLHPGQPADVAGLVPGDVIVQVNNQKTLTKEIFLSVIENSLPGDLLPFHGMRDRGMVSVMVKVGARGFNTRSAQNHIPVVRRLAATTLEDLDLNVEELHVLADRQLGLVSDCESGHARGDGDGGVGDSSASSKSFHKHSNDDSNDNRETGMSASNNDGRTSSMASQDRPRNGAVSTRQVGDKDGKNRMRNNENRDDNNNNNIDSDSGSGSGIKNYRRWKSQSDKSYLYTPVKGQRTKDRSVGGAVRRGRRERSADVAVRKGMRVSRSLSAVGEGRAGREEKRIRGGEGFSSVRKMGHNDLLGKLKLTRSLLMKKKKVRMYSR